MHDIALVAKYLKEILGEKELFWYQKKVLEDLFIKGNKEVFLNIPRKSGKTELEIIFQAVKAMLFPHSKHYFVSFTEENGREVMWGRAKLMIPPSWLMAGGFKESHGEIHFRNG